MKIPVCSRFVAAFLAALLATPWPVRAESTPPEKEKDKREETIVLTPFSVSPAPAVGYYAASSLAGSRLGATVGGAKDARYFRAALARGEFPDPETITAEGLFSEHDLPLRLRKKGRELFVLNAEAMPARLLTKPEVRYLAQIGLSSGLDAATWKREPLNLVAVVDKSGSMSGEPLELVRRSLHQVLAQLGPADQLSIVLYGDRAHVHLAPTRTTARNREEIKMAIDAIESAGSTNMEAGLRVGFDLARRSMREFTGRTRVMQFTDEQPNTGDTSAEGFMGLMQAASRAGIGQTTIGVGVEFDAKLATEISTVRGGNLFYFPSAAEMEKTFTKELDTMVTELAYDLELKVKPAPGLRLTEVYGIPGEMLEWSEDRTLRFHVSTVFLSRNKGAIYLAFAPVDDGEDVRAKGAPVASVNISYRMRGDEAPRTAQLALSLLPADAASPGLKRGRLLISEFLGLRTAVSAQLDDETEEAYRTMRRLDALFNSAADRSLNNERKLIRDLTQTLAKLSDHTDEPALSRHDLDDDDDVVALGSGEDEGYRARTIPGAQ